MCMECCDLFEMCLEYTKHRVTTSMLNITRTTNTRVDMTMKTKLDDKIYNIILVLIMIKRQPTF